MSDLILHEYEISPFSEKARRLLAFKGLPYRSVRVPAVMPKPDVVALTGGYRKTPFLQVGNHVYCDTSLIAKVLEALQPTPTLYPSPLAEIVAEWADVNLFEVTTPLAMRPTRFDDVLRYMTPEEMAQLAGDRATMRQGAGRTPPGFRACQAHLDVHLARLDAMLAGQAFLLGRAPCIADFSAFASVWFLETLAPEPLAAFTHVLAWSARLRALPAPSVSRLSSDEAIAIARAVGEEDPGSNPASGATTRAPAWPPEEPFADPGGLAPGQRVTVRPNDYGRDPVEGELAHATRHTVVVRRTDPRAGTVYVHFPRVGYETQKAP